MRADEQAGYIDAVVLVSFCIISYFLITNLSVPILPPPLVIADPPEGGKRIASWSMHSAVVAAAAAPVAAEEARLRPRGPADAASPPPVGCARRS